MSSNDPVREALEEALEWCEEDASRLDGSHPAPQMLANRVDRLRAALESASQEPTEECPHTSLTSYVGCGGRVLWVCDGCDSVRSKLKDDGTYLRIISEAQEPTEGEIRPGVSDLVARGKQIHPDAKSPTPRCATCQDTTLCPDCGGADIIGCERPGCDENAGHCPDCSTEGGD